MKIWVVAWALVSLVTLGGCKSSYTYEPIIPNPPNLEMANAQCEMMSTSAEQGMVAWGTPGYVAGAQIGNAIGNGIRVDQFMRQCMTLQGWRRVQNLTDKTSHATTTPQAAPALSPERRGTYVDALGLRHIASKCSITLPASVRADLERLNSASQEIDPSVAADGKAKGEKIYNDQVKLAGKSQACKRVAKIISEM
ncbi:hypothetical protein [Pararhizobium sp. O133]|uniref:hypothetical protein n=1 Tax=Pararhizobium sp. O133 TaxID=3449278 RepID=UPI003F688DE0